MLFQSDYGGIGNDVCDQVFTSFRCSRDPAGLGLGWGERVRSVQTLKNSVSGACRCCASPGLASRPSGWCGCSLKLVSCSLDLSMDGLQRLPLESQGSFIYLCTEAFSLEERSVDFGFRSSMPDASKGLFYIITEPYLSWNFSCRSEEADLMVKVSLKTELFVADFAMGLILQTTAVATWRSTCLRKMALVTKGKRL